MMVKGKTISLCIVVVILVVPILVQTELISAQTISKPSVPDFTVKFVDSSYDIPTTQTIDPYTGQEITNQGTHIQQKSIEIRIKNQAFKQFYDSYGYEINLYYNIRIKGYFEQNWTELYRPVYGFPQQTTDSEYTVFTYPWVENGETAVGTQMITLRDGAKADFQVEAMIGYIADAGPFSGRSPREYFEGETSGWSNTKSITIGEISNSFSPSPSVPEFSIVIFALFVIIPIVGLILIRGKIQAKACT